MTTPAATKVIDPVCGMNVTPERAAGQTTYEGTTHYFCGRVLRLHLFLDGTRCVSQSRNDQATSPRRCAADGG
jgi:YHS domain-containing protein